MTTKTAARHPKASAPQRKNTGPKPRPNYPRQTNPRSWNYFCLFIYALYCYAAFFPLGPVWGIHFIAYLPLALKIVLLAVGALPLVPGNQAMLYDRIVNAFSRFSNAESPRWILMSVTALAAFVLFRAFVIRTDIYGDNINMLKWYGGNRVFDLHWITDIFSLHLLDDKEALTVDLHRIVAYVFSIPIGTAYEIMSAVFGAAFVFLWLWFVSKLSSDPTRIVLALLGLFSGAVQVFFGHVENYSFGILTSAIFLGALYFYVEGSLSTLPFLLLYLLAFKAHIIAVLLVPAVLVALAYRYRESIPGVQFSWRSILTFVIVPSIALGILFYFFLFHSWNEPYALSSGRQFQQTFLPIVKLPAPLDRYSLWSPFHLADFFNLLLLTSAPVVVVLGTLLLFNRRAITWSEPRVVIFGLAALFPFLFFIAMNPLLTPERDWDVYTLLFPPLLFFAAMLLIQPRVRAHASAWLAQTFVFGVLFTTVMVAVNTSPLELETHLQDAGAYAYQSFYAGSAYIVSRAFVLDDSSQALPVHFASLVSQMEFSRPAGRNDELADMMSRLSSYYAFIGQGDSAIAWAERARITNSHNAKYMLDLAAYYAQYDHLDQAAAILTGFPSAPIEPTNADIAEIMSQLGARYSRAGNDTATLFWAKAAWQRDSSNLHYTYDLANYFMQTNRPRKALEILETIPPDSVSVESFTGTAIAEAATFGPDSGIPYLLKAKSIAPNDLSLNTLLDEMKNAGP